MNKQNPFLINIDVYRRQSIFSAHIEATNNNLQKHFLRRKGGGVIGPLKIVLK